MQTNIVSMKQKLSTMKAELNLYAPDQKIPQLARTELLYTKKDFLLHNPQARINELEAQKLLTRAKGVHDHYIPTVDLTAAYQKLGDPTSYGDNHSVGVALHLPLNGGHLKEAEALKVAALSKETKNIEYQIQREQEYTEHYQAYQNAKRQLAILERSQKDFEKSETTTLEAYLGQYVDFNTYLQVLRQALDVKSHMIALKSRMQSEAAIINAIASGKVYE